MPPRYPFIARVCLHLNWMFVVLWGLYLLGPDIAGAWPGSHEGIGYRIFAGIFFLMHFILVSTGIIALFVVIIEVHAQRPVHGFRSVLLALALPVVSFLYFAARYLLQVQSWGESQGRPGG